MNKFCDYIKNKRAEAKLTQEALADYMGVSLISVQNWESGRTKIQVSRIDKLADALNTDKKELYDKLNDMEEFSNWPSFLLTDEQNEIISTLRLTPEHKKLIMLLRIYNADNWNKARNRGLQWYDNVVDSLRKVPYKYMEDVGVFRLYEMGLHLEKFFKYIPATFCFDIIAESPNTDFDLRKLEKKEIIKWLDCGVFVSSLERVSYKNYYFNLVQIISEFKELSRKFENYGQYRYYCQCNNENKYSDYIVEIFDQETITLTTVLTEKGKQLHEWCKDIDM